MTFSMPGHAFHFCPSCGAGPAPVRDGKSIRCSRCGFHFFFNAASAVAAILCDNGRLLMTVRGREPGKGMLDLPGGFVDPGESAETALRREIQEELGISLDGISYFISFPNRYLYDGITYDTLDLCFICSTREISKIRAGDDVASSIFVPLDAIDYGRIAFESVRLMVRAFAGTRS